MKRKVILTLAAALCAVSLTACGGRDRTRDDRMNNTDVTVVRTETARTETVRTETATRSRTGQEARDLVSDAAEDVSEAVSDVAGHGRDLMTGIASDASDAIEERRGDGDYHADDDGDVDGETRTATRNR